VGVTSRRDVGAAFDSVARPWADRYRPGGQFVHRIERFRSALAAEAPRGAKVLDFGCGTGALALALADAGYALTGVDISAAMLDVAREGDETRRIAWHKLAPDWQRLPFEDGAFDAVTASSVLEYADDPRAVLRELGRVLRAKGVLLVTVPDGRHPQRRLERLLSRVAVHVPLSVAHAHPRLHGYFDYLAIVRHLHALPTWMSIVNDSGFSCRQAKHGERASLPMLIATRPD
jgi:ubiquinone/menaquinone biosynthesis C-methylase UbiE